MWYKTTIQALGKQNKDHQTFKTSMVYILSSTQKTFINLKQNENQQTKNTTIKPKVLYKLGGRDFFIF